MDAHSTQVLERLLAKELEPSAPEAQAAFKADPELLERFAELDGLQAALDEDAEEERDLMALLDADADAERAALQMHPGRQGWLVPASLAAAAALLFFFLSPLFHAPDPPSPPPLYLGSGDIEVLPIEPLGKAASFERFTIQASPASGSRVVFRVSAATGGPTLIKGTVGIDSAVTGPITWSPTRLQLDALPASIKWSAEVFDLEGERIGAALEILAQQ